MNFCFLQWSHYPAQVFKNKIYRRHFYITSANTCSPACKNLFKANNKFFRAVWDNLTLIDLLWSVFCYCPLMVISALIFYIIKLEVEKLTWVTGQIDLTFRVGEFSCSYKILVNGYSAQKIKFSIKDFICKCDQIRSLIQNYHPKTGA